MSETGLPAAIELSVVIAAHNARGVIEECLGALERQAECPRMQVIVADSSIDGTDEIVRRRFAWVELLHFDAPLTVPELRGKAIAVARGAVIAVLDPFSVAAADWACNVVVAHARTPNGVIGGLVDLHRATERGWLAWALYFNEYGLFMPPGTRGAVPIVPGSNVSYKRSVLFGEGGPRHGVFWKTLVNRDAQAGGSALWLEPAIRVALNKPIPFADFLRTRFDHGRCFAAMRCANRPLAERLLRVASAPLVPIVLMARWIRGFWPKRCRRAAFLLTMPLQLALFAMWAAGELVGYLRGEGEACRRLFY